VWHEYLISDYGSEAFCTAPIPGKLLKDIWAEGTLKPLPLQKSNLITDS